MHLDTFRQWVNSLLGSFLKSASRVASGGYAGPSDASESTVRWKSFWRVVFDVVNDHPRLLFETTLWDLDHLIRLGRSQEILEPIIHGGGVIPIVNGAADFGPTWLEYRVDLIDHERKLLQAAKINPDLESVGFSESLDGENVSIRVDVALDDPRSAPEHPFFYIEQPTNIGRRAQDSIRLYETLDGAGRRVINWWISGQEMVSAGTTTAGFAYGMTFDINAGSPKEAQHGVRVRQDRGNSGDVYEFLVDSIPLHSENARPPDHKFNHEPLIVYIGAMPDPNNPENMIVLEGQIAHLEFDPNNSCSNCAG